MTDINWMNMVTQTNWSWCIKCQGLFYSGQNNGPFLGVCPAGGQHSANPSAPYVVPFGDNLSFRTRRWLYKHYGRLGHTLFSWDEIRHDSYVFMSAAEATDSANPPDRFIGDAVRMSVHNVAPIDGGAWFLVAWEGDFPYLDIWVDVLLIKTN